MADIEQVIRAFFDEAAGPKLEAESDGSLFDHDSNWGFDPAALAAEIEKTLQKGRVS